MLRGIDVSVYQAALDVNSVAADFVIIKATGGTGYVNEHCDTHYQQATSGGKKRGVYHYYGDGWDGNDPIAEADWFVNNCLGYIGSAILILDWEKSGNPQWSNPAKAKACLDRIYSRTGVKPIIYMSLNLIQTLDWSAVINAGYGLWCAVYVDDNTVIPNYAMDANRDPNPRWDGIVNDVLWQFTSSGKLDGYGGKLDCNFFYGGGEAWDAYARSVNQPEPTTTTTTQAPIPEPTTTTTTTISTTTTTTTEAPKPEPTTTTTTTVKPLPTPPPLLWFAIWTFLLALLSKLKGAKK